MLRVLSVRKREALPTKASRACSNRLLERTPAKLQKPRLGTSLNCCAICDTKSAPAATS